MLAHRGLILTNVGRQMTRISMIHQCQLGYICADVLWRSLSSMREVHVLKSPLLWLLSACSSTYLVLIGVTDRPRAYEILDSKPQYKKQAAQIVLTLGIHGCDVEWMKRYGKLYGSYLFTQPEIVIADGELLKKVLVKDFHNFTNRRTFITSKKSLFNRMVTTMKDEDWKSTRNAITPAFTSGKLKGTVRLMESCVNIMCSILNEQTDFENGLDVQQIMGNLTIDVIGAAAFAMDVDAQRKPNNLFTKHARELANVSPKDWRLLFIIFFPWTTAFLDEQFGIRIFMPGMEEYYLENLTKIINERRQNPNADKLDFLQLLINVADNNDEKQNEDAEIDTAIDHRMSGTSGKKWQLSDRDIVAQSMLFLFGGHETTATTLTFACYLLAWNQEAQERAFQEIKALLEKDEVITYTHIQRSMPYMDAVLSETLRLFPTTPRFDRICDSDYQLTDQFVIPKGAIVCVPVYAIHHSDENYDEPETFDPERFLLKEKKNTNPFAYLPFGYGPRNCIGMRFAQLEFKLALSNVLKKFRIEPCPKTEVSSSKIFDLTRFEQCGNAISILSAYATTVGRGGAVTYERPNSIKF